MLVPYGFPTIGEREIGAVNIALEGFKTNGEWPSTEKFQQAFVKTVGANFGVTTNSLNSGLLLVLWGLGVGPHDEVIVPGYVPSRIVHAIIRTGAEPVFVDIEPTTCCINPVEVQEHLTRKTKCIICVDAHGCPCQYNELISIRDEYKKDVHIISDSSSALGSKYDGSYVGHQVPFHCFGLGPHGMISSTGCVITVCESEWCDQLTYNNFIYGLGGLEFSAIIGLEQLYKLEWILSRRATIAVAYNNMFQHCVTLLNEPAYAKWNCDDYQIRVKNHRDKIYHELQTVGLNVMYGYPAAYKLFKKYEHITLPVTEDVCNHTILLPLYPNMTQEVVDYVTSTVTNVIKQYT